MANDEEAGRLSGPAEAAGSPVAVWIGVAAGLTVAALAVGALLGLHLSSVLKSALQSGAKSDIVAARVYSGDANLRDLTPVITNLAEPNTAWVRLQASIIFDGKDMPKPDVVAAQIAEDILGYLRSLSMAQIGGASGLQNLREDLNERAAIRSEGRVRELIIQTLVVQ